MWVRIDGVDTKIVYDDAETEDIDDLKELILKKGGNAFEGLTANYINVLHNGVILAPKQSLPVNLKADEVLESKL